MVRSVQKLTTGEFCNYSLFNKFFFQIASIIRYMSSPRIVTKRKLGLFIGGFGNALRFIVDKNSANNDHGPDTGTGSYLVAENLVSAG